MMELLAVLETLEKARESIDRQHQHLMTILLELGMPEYDVVVELERRRLRRIGGEC